MPAYDSGIKLFRIFGFQVRIDLSWIIIAVLIAWTLSTGFFPFQYEDFSVGTYWTMGVIGALGLFVSIIIHELAHSLVAIRYGMRMRGITLFMFGGVSEMPEEPSGPKAEFMIAAIGPLSSAVLAGVFYLLYVVGVRAGLPDPVSGVIRYLAFINVLLALFNLVPAFPLDGGRILRSALWNARKDLVWATRIASKFGTGFGIFLIFSGVYAFLFAGNFVSGMWWVLIGFFLYSGAKTAYRQLLTRRALEGESVRRFIKFGNAAIAPDTTIERLVDTVYALQQTEYPVVSGDGKIEGCVMTERIKEIPKNAWGQKIVRDIEGPCRKEATIGPDATAAQALAQMNLAGLNQLLVIDKGRFTGMISLRDIMNFLALRLDLGAAM